MPVKVRKKKTNESGKPWKIVETETGKVVGESDSKADAEASARIRNEAHKKKRRGGKR